MKKYLITEDWVEGGYAPGWTETGRLELPPNGRWLTREQVRAAIDEPDSPHEQRVLYELFGSEDDVN